MPSNTVSVSDVQVLSAARAGAAAGFGELKIVTISHSTRRSCGT